MTAITQSAPRGHRRSAAARRAAILEAAKARFVRESYDTVSVRDIAADVGVDPALVFRYVGSKEELFAELLEQKLFKVWRELLVERRREGAGTVGEISAAMHRHRDSRWVIQLWLELMANAGRDERFRELAARMWRESRAFGTFMLERFGGELRAPPEHIAIAMMALETGLSLQHYADPDAVPLDLMPKLFELLFGGSGAS